MKWYILLGVSMACLLVAFTTMFAGYVPDKAWNDRAIKTNCTRRGDVWESTCYVRQKPVICYRAEMIYYVYANVCTKYINSDGGFQTRDEALGWVLYHNPGQYPCYMDPTNDCFRQNKLDVGFTLGVSIFMFVLGGAGLIVFLIIKLYQKHRTKGYHELSL